MTEPKPPSGTSGAAAWFRQLLDWARGRQVLSIEGYREQASSIGRRFLKAQIVTPGSAPAAPTPIKMFAIVSLGQSDYFGANLLKNIRLVNGAPAGDLDTSQTINIAKPPRMRRSVVSELFDKTANSAGVTITYSNVSGQVDTDNNRSATDGSNVELQVLFPRYVKFSDLTFPGLNLPANTVPIIAQCVIYATQPGNGTGVFVAGNQLAWLEVSSARVWAKRFS